MNSRKSFVQEKTNSNPFIYLNPFSHNQNQSACLMYVFYSNVCVYVYNTVGLIKFKGSKKINTTKNVDLDISANEVNKHKSYHI